MSIFDDIRRDREAGTPGPFFTQDEFLNLFALSGGNSGQTIHLAKINSLQLEHTGDQKGEALANLHRFARVLDLEQIALAAEELAKVFRDIVGYLEGLIEDGCPKCGGDCAGANPPLAYCPMKSMSNDLEKARSALSAFQDTTS